MAHDPSRTESATPKRRQKAREDGSVLRSQDLDATIMLWGNLFLFLAAWASTSILLARQLAYYMKKATEPGVLTETSLSGIGIDLLSIVLRILLPFFAGNFLLAMTNQFIQHGFHPSAKTIMPKFQKLNPMPGFKRLFAARAFVEILKSLCKFLIVAWVAYLVLSPRLHIMMDTMRLPLGTSIAFMQDTLFILYRNIMIVMIVIALGDFLYQRHEFEKNLRMTKQEVREEAKDAEGNPEIKGRQKSLMFASVMKRIRTQVPKASVVITNPTHFAVALQYDEKTAAPVCVAKGADHLALQIRAIAKENNVPIIENPPLARSLYRNVDVDKPIPGELYQAVAQVLAFVYRLKHVA